MPGKKSRRRDEQKSNSEHGGRPKLPAVLRRDGPLYAAIDLAEESTDDQVAALAGAFKRIADDLRTAARTESNRDGGTAETLRHMLTERLARPAAGDGGRAAFVSLLVAVHLDIAPVAAVERAGFEWYSDHFHLADKALGAVVPQPIRDAGSSRAYRTGKNPTAAHDLPEFFRQLAPDGAGGLRGVPTGIAPFDRVTGGVGEVTVLAGPTGVGKTTLAQVMALGVVAGTDDYAVLYCDFEQGRTPLYLRWLAAASRLPVPRIVSGKLTEAEREALDKGRRQLAEKYMPFVRVVSPAPNPYAPQIDFAWFRDEIKKTVAATGRPYCVVVIDSLPRMPLTTIPPGDEDAGRSAHSRPVETDVNRHRMDLLLTVQRWTQSPGCPRGFPIICVCRTRKTDAAGGYGIQDVYGGVETSYDASTVVIIEQDGTPTDPRVTPVRLGIKKHRTYGSLGDVRMDFHHELASFRERPGASGPDGPGTGSPPTRRPGKR